MIHLTPLATWVLLGVCFSGYVLAAVILVTADRESR